MGRNFKYLDKTLLVITILLFIFGLIMVFSASNVTAYMSQKGPYYYFSRQAIFLIVGLVASYFMLSNIFSTESYGRLSRPLLYGLIALLGVLLVYGTAKNQAVSWFEIGPFTVQPSEFVKVVTIVFLAHYYDIYKKKLNKWFVSLYPMGLCVVVALLIESQPDLGTTIIYVLIVLLIFFTVPISGKIKSLIAMFGLGLLVLFMFLVFCLHLNILEDRQMERFTVADPCSRILDDGNQVCNCYIAINNGGLTGVGLGNSTQKYLYLPEPYTDFIFAIVVEELGIITGIVVILLYMIVLYRILVIGRKAKNNRGAVMCYGIAFYIFIHIAVNLLGIMGIIPLTGVPLPFLSYGGSFTISLIAALAIVQKVAIESHSE